MRFSFLSGQGTYLISSLLLLQLVLFSPSSNAILIDARFGFEVADLSSTDDVILEVEGAGLNRRLMAAYNVNVFGQLWDVRFVDGKAGEIFNDGANLDIVGVFNALTFAEAIGEQVLRDSTSIFKFFNIFPQNVNGCAINPFASFCDILVPYSYLASSDAFLAASIRNDFSLDITNTDLNTLLDADVDTATDTSAVFTEWATVFSREFRMVSTPPGTPTGPTGSIPEPTSLALLLAGFFILLRLNGTNQMLFRFSHTQRKSPNAV